MRSILLFAFLFSCISVSFSQKDEEAYYKRLRMEDSIKVTLFLKQVDHIELLELCATCQMDTMSLNEDSDEIMVVERCFLIGAICRSGIDSSKIDCRRVAKNMDAFFQVFISSTKNKSYTSASCYDPRNGIIFFDKENQFLAYLEICFECNRIDGITNFGLSGFTSDQYAELECLFNQNGLKTK
jgi:hypothetical protein